MPESRLLRSKQKTWLLIDFVIQGTPSGSKEMMTVPEGTFVLQEVGERPSLDDTAQFRWIYVIHTTRGPCKAIGDHWEEWGHDPLKKD